MILPPSKARSPAGLIRLAYGRSAPRNGCLTLCRRPTPIEMLHRSVTARTRERAAAERDPLSEAPPVAAGGYADRCDDQSVPLASIASQITDVILEMDASAGEPLVNPAAFEIKWP